MAAGAVVGLIVYLSRQLGIETDAPQAGVYFAAGALVAGLAFGQVFTLACTLTIVAVTYPVSTLKAGILAGTGALPVAIAFYFVWSAAISATIVTGITYRQLVTPDRLQSRVNVIGRMVAWGGTRSGPRSDASFSSATSVGVAYTAAAGLTALSGVVALSFVRHARVGA
jgi:hypothetical protein